MRFLKPISPSQAELEIVKGEVVYFGENARYSLFLHRSKRQGIPSQYMIEDKEKIDEITGAPAVIRQNESWNQIIKSAKALTQEVEVY